MRHEPRGLQTAAVLSLAALFLLLAMGTALLGSGVYRRVAAEGEGTSTRRTALAYLANQLRRADEAGAIAVGTFGGADALFLYEDEYLTCLYCYDGALRELYAARDAGLTAEDGVSLLPLDALSVEPDGALLRLTLSDGGEQSSLSLAPRCGYEVLP